MYAHVPKVSRSIARYIIVVVAGISLQGISMVMATPEATPCHKWNNDYMIAILCDEGIRNGVVRPIGMSYGAIERFKRERYALK